MEQILYPNTLKNNPVVMFKNICFLSVLFFIFGFNNIANADECAIYKIKPKIVIHTPDWSKIIVQPTKPMDLLHGNVIATLVDNYEINTNITPVNNGFCVGLKSVDATIGYNNFLVQIDIRHNPKTCSYNAILEHENLHINAYLSVIEDYYIDLHNALYSASDSVMPIFVKNKSDIDAAIEKINNELQSHPDIILIMQKIHAAEEIKNKKVDQKEDYSGLKKCI